MSPLEILRFPYSLAFSGKELMGHFEAGSGLYCQNDEVSPSVHRTVTRSGRQIPPTVTTQQAASVVTAPHLTQRG